MKILIHGHEVGPSENLAYVVMEAARRKHYVIFVGGGELVPKSFNSIDAPDVILTGLSSYANSEELALGDCARNVGVPWVILADSHDDGLNPAAEGRVSNAILVVASPHEIESARRMGYCDIRYFGGPPVWQEFVIPRSFDLERPGPNSRIILVGGIKDGRLTDELLAVVIASIKAVGGGPWLVFLPHPREDPKTVDEERRASILARVQLVPPTEATLGDLIATVDLSVFTSGATGTIEAAYRRRPAVYFENEAVRENMRAQIKGSSEWFPAESGACVKANEETITDAIRRLLTPEGAAELRARQEDVYPIPPAGGERVEARIIRFLEKLVSARGYWINHVLSFVS